MSKPASSKVLRATRTALSQWSISTTRRGYASQPSSKINSEPFADPYKGPLNVAVLGGGITGLAAAYRLLCFPQGNQAIRITIFDDKPTLGGWLKSDFVDVPGGKVLLESGPRTLRPAGASGLTTLSLIHELGLEEELLTCSKDSVAAKNRYVYYPDHLVRMPSSLSDIPGFLREPLAEGLVSGVLRDLISPISIQDTKEKYGGKGTVDQVISERMHPGVTNLASAMLHGIYAGSVERLGFESLFPQGYYNLLQNKGLVRGMLADAIDATFNNKRTMHSADMRRIEAIAQRWEAVHTERLKEDRSAARLEALKIANRSSVYSFKRGLQQLSDALAQKLRRRSEIVLKTNCSVTGVRIDAGDQPRAIIETAKGTHEFTHVISTIPSAKLGKLLLTEPEGPPNRTKSVVKILSYNDTVTVMVVNLWYSTPNLLPVQGFGYLIPKNVPATQNPELGLGVVFDSDAIQGQDTVPGTKLTVMMGGHYWSAFSKDQLPSESEGVSNAKSLVARHLGITQEPVISKASIQYNCIPQYGPKHNSHMHDLGYHLISNDFKRRLIVAGASYDGVGVNDCISSGFSAADDILSGRVGLARVGLEQPSSYRKVPLETANWKFS